MRRGRLLTFVGALGGAALFLYAVQRAGPAEVLDGIRRVGWGLVLILVLAGIRFVIRAQCWRLCMVEDVRLPLGRAFSALLAGDAVGNITPLGLLASEPTKVLLTRHHLATRESVASLAVDNFVYAASALAMIAFGLVVMLATVRLPVADEWVIVGALAGSAGLVVVTRRLLRGTWNEERGARPRWRERLAAWRASVVVFASARPGRLWRVFALDLVFHALAVLEIFVTLEWLLGGGATVSQAIVFEALNRAITVAFKFVPFRVGVDEALSGTLAPLLTVNPTIGVTLAVVRKARNLFWAAIGLVLIAMHPVRGERAPVRS